MEQGTFVSENQLTNPGVSCFEAGALKQCRICDITVKMVIFLESPRWFASPGKKKKKKQVRSNFNLSDL